MSDNLLYEKARIIYSKYKDCKELQRSINIRTLISIILTLAWYYIWVSSAIAYFKQPYATFNPKNIIMYITAIVILIAPFILFKTHKYLSFKPFIGKLSDRKFVDVHVNRFTTHRFIEFNAKSLDGKKSRKIRMKAIDGLLDKFTNGTAIVMFRGLKHPIIIEDAFKKRSPDDTLMCPSCGHFNPIRYDRCFECASVIWNKNM